MDQTRGVQRAHETGLVLDVRLDGLQRLFEEQTGRRVSWLRLGTSLIILEAGGLAQAKWPWLTCHWHMLLSFAAGPTAAAIGNALWHALGVRARDLPFSPERVARAMP